jgi:hypothetical protein
MTESDMTETQMLAASDEDDAMRDDGNTPLGEISASLTSADIIAALRDDVRGEIEKLSARVAETSEAG